MNGVRSGVYALCQSMLNLSAGIVENTRGLFEREDRGFMGIPFPISEKLSVTSVSLFHSLSEFGPSALLHSFVRTLPNCSLADTSKCFTSQASASVIGGRYGTDTIISKIKPTLYLSTVESLPTYAYLSSLVNSKVEFLPSMGVHGVSSDLPFASILAGAGVT